NAAVGCRVDTAHVDRRCSKRHGGPETAWPPRADMATSRQPDSAQGCLQATIHRSRCRTERSRPPRSYTASLARRARRPTNVDACREGGEPGRCDWLCRQVFLECLPSDPAATVRLKRHARKLAWKRHTPIH